MSDTKGMMDRHRTGKAETTHTPTHAPENFSLLSRKVGEKKGKRRAQETGRDSVS